MYGEQFKPLCPRCGKPMRFVRAVPGIGAGPELWTFHCDKCAIAVTEPKSEALASSEPG